MKYIVVHHTAVSRITNPDQFQATNEYHKHKFNMLSSLGYYAGYNYVIASNGKITQARAEGEETAAQVGHNKDSISICLDGNFDIELPSNEQVEALKSLIKPIMAKYGISIDRVVPHRYFAVPGDIKGYRTVDGRGCYKTCYGSKLSDNWLRDILGIQPTKTSTVDDLMARARKLLASFGK